MPHCFNSLIEKCFSNINKNQYTGILFIDFAKAFDVINHPLLLRKLSCYQFSANANAFISSYLSDRQQCVETNLQRSEFLPLRHGVPQGSVLGPSLFSLYINDLPLYVKNSCEMFADDTSLQSTDTDSHKVVNKLQSATNNLNRWTELNHMSINCNKTKCMYVMTRQKRKKMLSPFPPLYIGQHRIDEVESHKVLGVIIDNNLSWSDHLTHLGKRLSQKIYQLTKIKHFLDINSRKIFFSAHILSLIDYASTLWDNASDTNFKIIKRVHKRALKLILLKSTSLTISDYKTLNILPLKLRLHFNKCVYMYNIMNGNAPKKLHQCFTINPNRHQHQLSFPRPRNNIYKSSLMYSGGMAWNNLTNKLKHSSSKPTFKISLRKDLMENIPMNM